MYIYANFLQASIDKLLQEGGRTTIVVAHRLSTIREADAIAVINQVCHNIHI